MLNKTSYLEVVSWSADCSCEERFNLIKEMTIWTSYSGKMCIMLSIVFIFLNSTFTRDSWRHYNTFLTIVTTVPFTSRVFIAFSFLASVSFSKRTTAYKCIHKKNIYALLQHFMCMRWLYSQLCSCYICEAGKVCKLYPKGRMSVSTD